MFMYGNIEIESCEKYRGATTIGAPDDMINSVVTDTILGDFTSLYPNCLISSNISPETIYI